MLVFGNLYLQSIAPRPHLFFNSIGDKAQADVYIGTAANDDSVEGMAA